MVVLVTGAGAPGFIGTFKSLVHNYDNRQIDIIATDMYDDVIGKYYAKKFYQIPPAIDDDYLDRIKEIYYKEKVDVLLPQNTMELSKLVGSGMNVCVSNNVSLANNKAILYDTAKEIGVPIPNYVRMKGKVVVKPVVGHGSKGLHIIDGEDSLVSEYLEGDEYTVDCFRGNRFVAIPRLRKKVVNGITWDAQVVRDQNLIDYSRMLAHELDLKYAFGFQFKGGKLLECNPRVQGTMMASTFAGANIIYSAVKYALGEEVPEFNIDWDSRVLRYSILKAI